jgi:hypothetical protein
MGPGTVSQEPKFMEEGRTLEDTRSSELDREAPEALPSDVLVKVNLGIVSFTSMDLTRTLCWEF